MTYISKRQNYKRRICSGISQKQQPQQQMSECMHTHILISFGTYWQLQIHHILMTFMYRPMGRILDSIAFNLVIAISNKIF